MNEGVRGIHVRERDGLGVIEVHVTAQLKVQDYEIFGPIVSGLLIRNQKIRLLLVLEEFEGWDQGTAWHRVPFEEEHHQHIERMALVGETRWVAQSTRLWSAFDEAEVRYYERCEETRARRWLEDSSPSS